MKHLGAIQEKRLSPRVSCQFFDSSIHCCISNISSGGLYLETSQKYPVNQVLSLSFPFSDEKDFLHLRGKIVRSENRASPEYGYGLSFQEIEESVQKKIKNFVRTEIIYSRVKEVFYQILPDPEVHFKRTSSVVRDLHVDSLKVAELSILLEQDFDQSIFLPDWLSSEESPEDLTVHSLVNFLSENLEEV